MSETTHRQRGSETILYIEDLKTLRQGISTLLRRTGYGVLEADTAQAGLALFQERVGEVDLILLDLELPDQRGREMLPLLRAIDPRVKVIIFTAHGWETPHLEGIQAILEKPTPIATVLQTVRTVLDQE